MRIKKSLVLLLSLTLLIICIQGSFAQKKRLTVDNKTIMPLQIFIDPDEQTAPAYSIGFLDPSERITFSYPLQLGRWYLKIVAYAPSSNVRRVVKTLYVKQSQDAYIYELYDGDFSGYSINTPPNISIIGTWVNRIGLATQFRREAEEYIGTITAVPDSMTKFGLYAGFE